MVLIDVMICTCGARNPRKHACEESKEYLNRVDGTSAWRAARRLDGPSAGVFAGLARGKLLKKQAETPRVPLG